MDDGSFPDLERVSEGESEGNNFSPNDTIDYISTQHANGPFLMAAAPSAFFFFFF